MIIDPSDGRPRTARMSLTCDPGSMPNVRPIAGSVLLVMTMAVTGAAQGPVPSRSRLSAPTNESPIDGRTRDSTTRNGPPHNVRHGPAVYRAGVVVVGTSNKDSHIPILQERHRTPGRGWLIFLGVLAGAYIGMQATDCEGCFLPDFGRMLIGGIVGGLIVSSAIP